MNFRILTAIFFAVILSLSLTGLALAGGDDEAASAMKMKPKDLYKYHCKVCHDVDSPAEEYTPMTLIQEQWQDFFAGTYQETHEQLVWPADQTKKLSEIITPEMLEKIEKFCVDHAADSEQPMTCG